MSNLSINSLLVLSALFLGVLQNAHCRAAPNLAASLRYTEELHAMRRAALERRAQTMDRGGLNECYGTGSICNAKEQEVPGHRQH